METETETEMEMVTETETETDTETEADTETDIIVTRLWPIDLMVAFAMHSLRWFKPSLLRGESCWLWACVEGSTNVWVHLGLQVPSAEFCAKVAT